MRNFIPVTFKQFNWDQGLQQSLFNTFNRLTLPLFTENVDLLIVHGDGGGTYLYVVG